MLVSNKINVDEACRLLFVVEPDVSTKEETPQLRKTSIAQSQYLRTCLMTGLNGFR